MLSRVAESIYWMNRYLERAENVARFIDANFNMILDLPVGAAEQWEPLVITTGDHEYFREHYGAPTRENVIHFLTFDTEYPNSIMSCLRGARECARSVREYISSEMWEQINKFYLMVRGAAPVGTGMELPHQFFVEVMMASHLLSGITYNTMSHGEGWHFGRMGRMLERADKTSRILDVKYFILLPSVSYVGSPYDNILWGALLRSASAFEMYRKKFGRIAPDDIVEFLVLDREFPRAILFCLIIAEESLRAISGTPAGRFNNPAEHALGKLRAELNYAHLEDVLRPGLHEFLDALQTRINLVGDAVFEAFFALRPIATQEQRQARSQP